MIAIPNMSKPKSCWECRLMDGEANCLVTDEGISSKQEGIHPDCPLIDIVQCKECKYSHMTYGGQCKYCDWEKDDDDNYIECYFDGDHFCGYGERK